MQVYKTPHDAAAHIAKRISSTFWQDRLYDMIRHACLAPSNDGSTPIAMHNVRVDRVASQWPLAGSISITRDDGKKFRLVMKGRNFKVEVV